MNPASTAPSTRAARQPARHREQPPAHRAELNRPERPSPHANQNTLAKQHLTLVLEGITAGDYLTWMRDPDPHTLGGELRSADVQAHPLGDRIDVLLHWNTTPPAPPAAAPAAGFHLTPEVIALHTSHPKTTAGENRTDMSRVK
jgi:hypothetical protein